MVQKNELERSIWRAAQGERRSGWANYVAAYCVAILALIGSIAAGLLVAFEVNKAVTAVIAVIPAAVLSITKIFNFEHRAFFHWRKFWRFRGLLHQLTYENMEPKEVSKAFDNVDMEMLNDWIPFGTSSEDGNAPGLPGSAPENR